MMKAPLLPGLLVYIPLAIACGSARAQLAPLSEAERSAGITVSGTGEVSAKPNLVEIDLQNSGTAELSGDAIVKYRDNKRRMLQAFEGLKLKNLEITERGISLTGGVSAEQLQQVFMRGGAQAPAEKPQLQVSRTIRLTLGHIEDVSEEDLMETLGRIFDVARDFGITMVPSPEAQAVARQWGRNISGATANFVLDKIAELREQAYRKAVDDARGRAQRLANLTGVRLGSVLSVQEVQVAGDEATAFPQPYYYGYPGTVSPTEAAGPRVTSPVFVDVPVRVRLLVRFSIAKPEAEAAQN